MNWSIFKPWERKRSICCGVSSLSERHREIIRGAIEGKYCWQIESSWLLDIDRQSIWREVRIKTDIRVLKRELRSSKAPNRSAIERKSNTSNNSSFANDSKFIFLFYLQLFVQLRGRDKKKERNAVREVYYKITIKKQWITSPSLVLSFLSVDESLYFSLFLLTTPTHVKERKWISDEGFLLPIFLHCQRYFREFFLHIHEYKSVWICWQLFGWFEWVPFIDQIYKLSEYLQTCLSMEFSTNFA
jgi:hypothetical protein